MSRTVAVVTLGCARNEVDSEELAGRLAADGWILVDDVEKAEVALVNTCGFIESAKKDSVDALLEANSLKGHGVTRAVVAVGCMAERYGQELAEALPEADAILGFDDYKDISARLQSIVSGNSHTPHVPRDRRSLLPIAPVDRAAARDEEYSSKVGAGGTLFRKRLGNAPWAPLKIASGCDRRCSFCAIPYFRGSFVSRRPVEILEEAKWLAANGVSELFLVSENTTSYGKDLGDLRLMETILPEIASIAGVERVRLSYLQPAEMRPSLLQAMVSTEKTAPYFDLSFQHTSQPFFVRCADLAIAKNSYTSLHKSEHWTLRRVFAQTSSSVFLVKLKKTLMVLQNLLLKRNSMRWEFLDTQMKTTPKRFPLITNWTQKLLPSASSLYQVWLMKWFQNVHACVSGNEFASLSKMPNYKKAEQRTKVQKLMELPHLSEQISKSASMLTLWS